MAQKSVYLPILKQGGDTNTIAVVDGVKKVVSHLFDVPKNLVTKVVFDQSAFVKQAIDSLLHEGGMGLFLTAFNGAALPGQSAGHDCGVLSIPLSALAAIIALYFGGSSINTMVLAGLALAFSRLIDNSVIVLENIFRHLELGESAGGCGGTRRPGSVWRRSGGNLDHGRRLLSRHISLWGRALPVLRAWPWRWFCRSLPPISWR